jgi:hypothetical protein
VYLKNNFSLTKLGVYYNKVMHVDNNYLPNSKLDDTTETVYSCFLENLPHNSKELTVCEIGSGAGKWTSILSNFFKKVISIEPKVELSNIQKTLLKNLKISNVEIINDYMPRCLDYINCECIFFSESLYLVNDWASIIDKTITNKNIKYIGIIDGPDEKPFYGLFHEPFLKEKRLPLLDNDELIIQKKLESNGFNCQLFDIFNFKKTNIPPYRWYLVGQRK